MFSYTSHLFAPGSVEFRSPTTSKGYRVVRVFLNHPNPRIMAFNESQAGAKREPALLWYEEIENLVADARRICNPLSTEEKHS